VLTGLGHHAFIGGDDEEGSVNAAYPGEHVLDKVTVSRHIHDAHRLAVGEREPGEAQVNRHLPLLLLAQAIGVDAGEGVDEGGFAVIYVPGGADDVHSDNSWLRTFV